MTLARRRDRTKGASSIELAMYTPILFLVIFGIVQFALSWHANQVASATAREAARVARIIGGGPEAVAQAEQRGYDFAAQAGSDVLHNVTVTVVMVGTDQVRVTVDGRSTEIINGLSPRVSQTVQGPVEQFRPDL